MNWGTKIVFSFIAFAGLIITMVVISMRQDVSLVAKDYYVQEIAYQDQIDKIQNQKALESEPTIKLSQEFVEVSMNTVFDEGTIHFFRPSDASQDMLVKLDKRVSEAHKIDRANFSTGKWLVKLNWKHAGEAYYYEQNIYVP